MSQAGLRAREWMTPETAPSRALQHSGLNAVPVDSPTVAWAAPAWAFLVERVPASRLIRRTHELPQDT